MCNTSLFSCWFGFETIRDGEPEVGKGSRDRAGLPTLLLLFREEVDGILEGLGDVRGLLGLIVLLAPLRKPPDLKMANRLLFDNRLRRLVEVGSNYQEGGPCNKFHHLVGQ